MSQSQNNPQNTQKTNVQNSSGLEIVSVGYGEDSSGVKEAKFSQDQLDQVADNVNAGVDKEESKWKSEQDWNDTSWKVWLD